MRVRQRSVLGVLAVAVLGAAVMQVPATAGGATSASPTPVTACGIGVSPATLVSGQTLAPGGCLIDPTGTFELTMQPDGNLVEYVIAQMAPIWYSATPGNPGASASMGTDGSFAVTAGGATLWSTDGQALVPGSYLVQQSDGNVVVYPTGDNGTTYGATWASGSNDVVGSSLVPTDCPTASSDGSCVLEPGQSIISPSLQYRLTMQTDGNLVLTYQYAGSSEPLWDSMTGTHAGAYAVMQTDGNFVVDTAAGNAALWSSRTQGTHHAYLTLQTDGNAVVYANSAGQQTLVTGGVPYAAWSTLTANLRGYRLASGQFLEPGQTLKSQNGRYGLTMGQPGAIVLFETGLTTGGYQCPMWSVPSVTGANPLTYGFTPVPNSTLQMTASGDLAIWNPGQSSGVSEWNAGSTGTGNYAELQTDGNLVVYSAGGIATWSSGTGTGNADQGWALCTGNTLSAGDSVYAAPRTDGAHLEMQATCNLVLYKSTGSASWASNTDYHTSNDFKRSSNHSTLYDSVTPGANFSGCYAKLEATGNLVIIAPNCGTGCPNDASGGGVPGGIWSSETNNLGPKISMPLGSFGPFLVYPTTTGELKIDNAAGFTLSKDPEPGDTGSSATEGKDIGKQIWGFVMMVLPALLL